MLLQPLVLIAAALLARGDGFFQDATYDQALALAAKEQRTVVIDFFTTWCMPCKRLDATTWKDPAVLEWGRKHGIAIKLDAEKEVELARRFRINSYPTILLLRPDGSEIDRLFGYRDGPTFLGEVNDALAGRDAISRAKLALAGHENDPMSRGKYADALARKGRYEEALAEYLWCFDNGEKSRAYTGVRLSILLGDIKRLGAEYPPALDALRARRDVAEVRLVAKPDDGTAAREFVALNRTLGTSRRSLELYDRVSKGQGAENPLKIAFGTDLLPLLVEDRRYGDVLQLFDRPEGFVEGRIKRHGVLPAPPHMSDEARKAIEGVEPMLKAAVVEDCRPMYEAVVGLGQNESAQRIADRLIAFAPTGDTHATLITAARRAGAHDTARALGDRALASLPEVQLAVVRQALASLPKQN